MPKIKLSVLIAALLIYAMPVLADPTTVLRDELRKTPGSGTLVKTFQGRGGLTGVVMKTPTGEPMIAYVTPNGRYIISGAVIDLATGENITAQDAVREIGASAIPNPEQNQKTVYELGRMQGIMFGNARAQAYMAVVFDPSTDKGRLVMMQAMQEAGALHSSGQDATMQIRFYPYGPIAARLLVGSNVQRLHNLLTFVSGKPLPAADANSTLFEQRNTASTEVMPAKSPLMVVFDPTSQFARVVSFAGGNVSPAVVHSLGALQNALMQQGAPGAH